jgi:DNA-binding SARP family transcriptional activator
MLLGPSSVKARLLLAFLGLHLSREIPREYLAEILWPNHHSENGLFNLRQLLYRLRKELPEISSYLEARSKSYLRFSAENSRIDVLEFEKAALKRDHSAIKHYVGSFLPGFGDEWVLTKRIELEGTYLRLVSEFVTSSNPADTIELAGKALLIDPYREDFVRHLMTAQAALGNAPAALATYHSFEQKIGRDLGLKPSTETTALYSTIVDGSVARSDTRLSSSIVWREMPSLEVDRLVRLNLFHDSWSEAAFLYIFEETSVDGLDFLVSEGAIERVNTRFRLTPFGKKLASIHTGRDLQNYADRHLEYFRKFYRHARENWHGRQVVSVAERLSPDLENGRAAFEWAVQSRSWNAVLELASDLAVVRGMLGRDPKPLLETALKVTSGNVADRARKRALATACWCFGSASEGIDHAEARQRAIAVASELLAVAHSDSDPVAEGTALECLGQMWFPSLPEKAEQCLNQALNVKKQLGEKNSGYFVFIWLARLKFYEGRWEEALELLGEAASEARAADNLNALAGIAIQFGAIKLHLGEYQEAIGSLLEGLDTSERIFSDYDARAARLNLLLAYAFSENVDGLDKHLIFAIPRARDLADALQTDQVELMSAWLQFFREDYEGVLQKLPELVAKFLQKGSRFPFENYIWSSLGLELGSRCFLALGREQEASEILFLTEHIFRRDSMKVDSGAKKRWRILQKHLPSVTPDRAATVASLSDEQIVHLLRGPVG